MFVKSPRANLILSLAFVVASGACSDTSGCGCTSQPLPGGALPADQTVEGGAQVRVTPAGMTKVNQVIQTVLTDSLGDGFCVDEGSSGGSCFLRADYCDQNQGGACGAARGCNVPVALDFINISVTSPTTLRIEVQVDMSASVHIDADIACIGASCTLGVNAQNLYIDITLAVGIRPSDGELTLQLQSVNNTDFGGVSFSGCSIVSDLGNILVDILDSFIGDFIIDALTPTLDDLIQGLLPDPIGVEGMIDIGAMVGDISPGTTALMEGRFVPGGYVSLNGGGMTLGVITGVNADEDIGSRATDLDSEPHLCVPPFAAPNFSAPPASLPLSSRNTFTLAAAGAFSGLPDPANDVAIGLSETTLDLFGHHLVSSGGMCLGVGTRLAEQLNVSTISLLVPSLGELVSDQGNDPLLLVLRPQRPLDFAVGDGVSTPQITIKVSELEIDFYAFLYERYTRAFTLSLTMDIGIDFTVDNAANPVTLTPSLTGLSASDIQIRAFNSEFVRETPAELEAVLPTVFDLALPLLADGLDPIDMPDFSGFSLRNVSLGKVTTTQDDFFAINAALGPSARMRARGSYDPRWSNIVVDLDRATADPDPQPMSGGNARLGRVNTPAPEDVRAALQGQGGEMPSVTIDVDPYDALGRPLEWSWRLDGGLWRPFTTAAPLVIADRAFAWQGKYTIALRSRVVGTTRTEAAYSEEFPVIIDSVPPKILEAEVGWIGDCSRSRRSTSSACARCRGRSRAPAMTSRRPRGGRSRRSTARPPNR